MADRQIRLSAPILFTWLTLAALILFFAPERITGRLQHTFASILRFPLSAGHRFSLLALASEPIVDSVSRVQYIRLQNHLANVIECLNEERQKVEKLSGLPDRPVWKGVNFVLADVITAAIDGSQAKLIINRGKSDGLQKDQFVMGDYSIIGTICDLDRQTAQVRLITDPTSKLPVKLVDDSDLAAYDKRRSHTDSDGTPAVMHGSGGNCAKIQLLPKSQPAKKGWVVYAQKKPGQLSTAMVVGTVTECRAGDENPLLWDITVTPACETAKLTQVCVLVMNPPLKQTH